MTASEGRPLIRRAGLQTTLIVVVLAALFAVYVRLEKQGDRASEARFQALALCDELRRTSDDLTRMARSYVATGDPRYKRYFQEILDIREGVKPRPVNYRKVYWDLVLADDRRPGAVEVNGPAISLLQLIRDSGFTEAEFARLAESKAKSDALTRLEFAAMALFDATHPPTEATRAQALQMLFDAHYHQAKHGVMRPISEFQEMTGARTLEAVHLAQRMALLVRTVFVLFGALVLVLQWRSHRTLHRVLGATVDELHGRIARLGGGDFLTDIPVAKNRQNTVMGWLAATQIKLKQQDAERQRLDAKLRDLAFRDPLTGLPNRRLLLDRLQRALHVSTRNKSYLAVLFIDLDGFKLLNDRCGHEMGDRLLVDIARQLQQQVRQSDTAARYGGDEFVVLLEQLGADLDRATADAGAVADKLRLVLDAEYVLGQVQHRNAASIGITLSLGNEDDADAILRRADDAMYRAKQQSRLRRAVEH